MRKSLVLLILGLMLALPLQAAAQDEIRIASLNVKLWPEDDQPSMLVISDFQVQPGAALPLRVNFRLPQDATLNAIAALDNGSYINSESEGPKVEGEWQVVTAIVNTATTYRIEYYQPLSISGKSRQFSYLWPGDYQVDAFSVSVQQPPDVTSMTTDPAYPPTQGSDGLTYYNGAVTSLKAGEQYTLNIQYEKTSDNLTVTSPNVQPSAPLNENTSGRVSLNNYIPYIIGIAGVILVAAGLGYYFWGRQRPVQQRHRRRSHAQTAEDEAGEVYCPQCGQRARPGDRFCRVCGTRLRQSKS